MEYNGKNMTWKEFQEYWKGKEHGGWIYGDVDDTKNRENKKRF